MTRRESSSQPLLLVVLAGLGMVGPFSIDMIFPAFAQMSDALGVTDFALQQLLSAYLVAFAVMSLFHGPISDAVGRKRVIIAGLLVYAAASVASALAPGFGTLVALRAVQGASAGAGQIISRAVVSDLFHGQRAQRVMSHIAMIFGLAPALAPIVGGWLLLAGDWRVMYWFLAAFGLVLVLLTVLFLPESHPAGARSPLRLRPLLTSLWAVWRHRDGRRLALAGMFNFAGMFTLISSAPLFVVGLLGGGEQDFWVLFVPLIGGMVAGSFVSGRAAGLMPPRAMASLGYRISLVGGLLNLALALLPATQGLPWAVLALPVYTFGVALAFPVLTLEMLQLFPQARGAASSVQSFVQLSFNAVIAGVIAPLVAASVAGLAATAVGLTVVGWLGWRRHLAKAAREGA
ncbi:MAG: multidrug effflux MFS transporter [Propioniciclava sp.]|uniref:multidrug effflux MFS transporter n=1 Tax=Propioniciclava sp. TaxID=2038686 RepID=UPI0039E37C18